MSASCVLVWVYAVSLIAAVGMKHYLGTLAQQQQASTVSAANSTPYATTPYLASPYEEEAGSFHNSRSTYNADRPSGLAYSTTTTTLSSADL